MYDILTQMFTRVHFPRIYIEVSFAKQACGQIIEKFSNLESLGAKVEMLLFLCRIYKVFSSVILEGREECNIIALESSKVQMLSTSEAWRKGLGKPP